MGQILPLGVGLPKKDVAKQPQAEKSERDRTWSMANLLHVQGRPGRSNVRIAAS
jgi:hypothetical protein